MPATYGDMVQCGRCEQWFHIKCVGLPSLPCSDEEWVLTVCIDSIVISLSMSFKLNPDTC